MTGFQTNHQASGPVAQSVRASISQPKGPGFESGIGHVVHIHFSAIIDNWFVGVSIMLPAVDLLKILREVGDVKLIYQSSSEMAEKKKVSQPHTLNYPQHEII